MRKLGLGAEAISRSLRMRLGLDTGEIAEVIAYPITPPDGVVVEGVTTTAELDLRDAIDAPSAVTQNDHDASRGR
jgi:hypothetical protein